MTIYTSTVQEDPDTKELILELPLDLISEMKWTIDTQLVWVIDENNNVYLSEVK